MYSYAYGGQERVPHAQIDLPKPQVGLTHPFINEKNHQKLLEYLEYRLMAGARARDARLDRLVSIDKAVSGWMRLSDDDLKRQEKVKDDGIPLQIDVNLPLTFVHLDDQMTYFAATFSPTRGMFYHSGKPGETGSASQIVTIMNNNAIYAGYYRETLLGTYNLLKYNFGGFHVEWKREQGPKVEKGANGQDTLQQELVWQGNSMKAVDVYNFLADSSVHPTDLHKDGEFAAVAYTCSEFWLRRQAGLGLFFNVESELKSSDGRNMYRYYKNPPKEAMIEQDQSTGTDWRAVLSAVDVTPMGEGIELVKIFINLNPTEFGLLTGSAAERKTRSRYEQWRFTIMNGRRIIDATYMNNVHGHLPFYMGVLNDDAMGPSQKSNAEILNPLQQFASGLLNTHVKGTRKNIYSTTIYDPSKVDVSGVKNGDVAARLPLKREAAGTDVRTVWHQMEAKVDTRQTMGDLESVMGLISEFFPTQSLPSQIASIDRAVKSQVAAVQQGVNRRQQKGARLLDETVMRNVRTGMYYNILQYQNDESEVQDFYTGNTIKVNLAQLRKTDLPFIIGQGLKAVDRQAAQEQLRELIFTLIQAPQAQQMPDGSRIDMLKLINHWVGMMDIDIDMEQFRIAAPQPAAVDPTTGQPVAGAEGAITPATAPGALATPIYGGGGVQ